MRICACSAALGAVLILGISCGAWAQDQPAAGSPPPASAQAPAQARQDQSATPAQSDNLPPLPIDARRAPNPRRQARMLARRLGLTPEQQTQIEPILANRQQRMQKARADATLAPRDRRAVVREINRDSLRRVNAVLTPVQREQYKQLRQEQRAKRMEQREQQRIQALPPSGNQ